MSLLPSIDIFDSRLGPISEVVDELTCSFGTEPETHRVSLTFLEYRLLIVRWQEANIQVLQQSSLLFFYK